MKLKTKPSLRSLDLLRAANDACVALADFCKLLNSGERISKEYENAMWSAVDKFVVIRTKCMRIAQ